MLRQAIKVNISDLHKLLLVAHTLVYSFTWNFVSVNNLLYYIYIINILSRMSGRRIIKVNIATWMSDNKKVKEVKTIKTGRLLLGTGVTGTRPQNAVAGKFNKPKM